MGLKRRHTDLLAGVAALAWGILSADPGGGALVPQLGALCSPEIAGPFGFVALGRWYHARWRDG